MKLKPGQKMQCRHIRRERTSSGREREIPVVAYNAKREVVISLTEDDVRLALENFGQGDPSCCAGAVCTVRHSHLFSHAIGDVEYVDRRLYVYNRFDKYGMPTTCVVYEHHDNVAKLFDTKAGLKKLLAQIRENGPKVIRLYPVKESKGSPNRTGSKEDGSRTKVHHVKKVGAGAGRKSSGYRIFRTTQGLLRSEAAAA